MKKITYSALFFIILFSLSVNAQTISKCDQKFTEKSMDMGLVEVKDSELAQSKAVTPSVRTVAGQIAEYHNKANNDLKNVASKKNIAIPSMLSDKEQKMYDKLAKYEGKKFDKKYTHCMKKMHKKGICKLKKEARHGKDSELTAWANAQVPIYENHIKMLKDACKDIK